MARTQGWRIAKKRGQKKNRVSPFAPSKKELAQYRLYIKKAKKNKRLPRRTLVLGATPELRDVSIANQLECLAVDISQEMMDKFSALMKYNGHKLDRQIIRNWLRISYPKNYFAVVMGDASLNNLVNKRDNERMVNILKKVTAPGGFVVLRQVVYPNNYKPIKDLNKLINLYRHKKITWEDFFMELRICYFKKQVYNKKSFRFDAGKTFKLIDKLFQKNILTKKEYNRINIFRNNVINTFYLEKAFTKMIEKKGFKLVKSFHDKPHRFFKYLYLLIFIKE